MKLQVRVLAPQSLFLSLLTLWYLGHSKLTYSISAQSPSAYDLIIRQGKIIDGTGNPWFVGDVAVHEDRIVAVARKIDGPAKTTIPATGLVVAPGFIDIHSHSDFTIFEDGHAQSKIRQGVTTDIIGEGFSAAPYKGKLTPRPVTVKGERVYISTLHDYFNALDQAGSSINIASYVGLGNLWQSVMGHSFDTPSEAELDQMKTLLAEAMEHGALGLSSQLMMPPGLLATTDQIVALCEVVRQYGGIYSSHIRNEGLGVFEAVNQAIEIGERAHVPVDIIHLKIADQQYWGRMNEIIALIEAARRRGVNVQANVYPYTRGNNNLSSIIPPWAHEGGREQMLQRLQDPAARKRLKHDIRNGVEGWYNHYTAVGGDWNRMLVSASNRYRGMTMQEVMTQRTAGKNPRPELLDELFDLLIEMDGSVSTVYAHHTEPDMNLALRQPWCSVGSDGSALATDGVLRRGNPHPRNFGTFPRVLGRYVREQPLLTLEEAIRKMTSLNAAKVGIHDRGLLKQGLFADITIFDPDTIKDQADFTDPFHYNQGIHYVIVNGQIVLKGEQHTGAKPGRALRSRLNRAKTPRR
jgi:N-acyl-D-amino-acid deacylase